MLTKPVQLVQTVLFLETFPKFSFELPYLIDEMHVYLQISLQKCILYAIKT